MWAFSHLQVNIKKRDNIRWVQGSEVTVVGTQIKQFAVVGVTARFSIKVEEARSAQGSGTQHAGADGGSWTPLWVSKLPPDDSGESGISSVLNEWDCSVRRFGLCEWGRGRLGWVPGSRKQTQPDNKEGCGAKTLNRETTEAAPVGTRCHTCRKELSKTTIITSLDYCQVSLDTFPLN